jgi:hypothetical protein
LACGVVGKGVVMMKGLRTIAGNLFWSTLRMLWPPLLFLFVLFVVLAAGCTPGDEPVDESMGEVAPIDEPAQAEREEQYPLAVEAGIETISRDLGVAKTEVEVISYYQTEWEDGCLGLGEAGQFCTQEIVSGWHIFVQVAEHQEYEVRTNENGRNVRWHRLQ